MARATNGQELWDLIRTGDAEAFTRFFRSHEERLRNFLTRAVGDAKAAEDIGQQTFLALWQHPNGFNPGRGSLKAYLFGIAARRAKEWWRQRARDPRPISGAGAAQHDPPLLIQDAFERLEPDCRSLLWLREVEGYSYAELAEILDIHIGTVKSRLFAAREELRRIWKGEKA
jgi:RNA polymerase sigma-70 factor, ECF subfamily